MSILYPILCLVTPLLLMLTQFGCGSRVIPPAAMSDPVTIAVPDYGRHSSLVLPDGNGGVVEYAFGDWHWFAAGHNSLRDGVRALFRSPGSTLGRRYYEVTVDSPRLGTMLKARHVARVRVSAERMMQLKQSLERRYGVRASREVFNEHMGMWFVPDDEPYGLFRNCNHVTADWLREMGCDIRGSSFGSRFNLAR